METIAIEGNVRSDIGKKATKALRKQDAIPCELYGGEENIHFSADRKAVKDIIYTPNFYVAELNIEGKTHKAIVKDIQFHPITDAILHIDFQELVPGTVIRTEVPVRAVGTAEGVKTGGKLLINVRKLIVKTTPENLKDKIEINVSKLKLGQSFKVRDIGETGMQIMNAPGIPIAAVEIPRSLRSAGSLDTGSDEEEGEEVEEGAEAAAEE
ncbi:MAG: 50S ribosomal protein L25/general stress protein Ctc [Bacteroidetes bacterium]|nr:50S ribosomal protein L25/general stress protein Ctc [Bacteroidota bacterium]